MGRQCVGVTQLTRNCGHDQFDADLVSREIQRNPSIRPQNDHFFQWLPACNGATAIKVFFFFLCAAWALPITWKFCHHFFFFLTAWKYHWYIYQIWNVTETLFINLSWNKKKGMQKIYIKEQSDLISKPRIQNVETSTENLPGCGSKREAYRVSLLSQTGLKKRGKKTKLVCMWMFANVTSDTRRGKPAQLSQRLIGICHSWPSLTILKNADSTVGCQHDVQEGY